MHRYLRYEERTSYLGNSSTHLGFVKAPSMGEAGGGITQR